MNDIVAEKIKEYQEKGWIYDGLNVAKAKQFEKEYKEKYNQDIIFYILKFYAKVSGTGTGGDILYDVNSKIPISTEKFLKRFSPYIVKRIQIGRSPVKSYVEKILNLISAGEFEQRKKELNYDKIFHLFLILYVSTKDNPYPSNVDALRLEKNQTVEFNFYYSLKDLQTIELNTPAFNTIPQNTFDLSIPNAINVTEKPVKMVEEQLTAEIVVPYEINVKDFYDHGIEYLKSQGLEPYIYNGNSNNCQTFINAMLEGNQLNTKDIKDFVLQDSNYIVSNLPALAQGIIKGTTDVAAFVSNITEYFGLPKII
jgi:hypothetical protein